MDKIKKKTFVTLHILLFIFSFGGICSKLAAEQEFLSWRFILYYGAVLGMLAVYAVLWQQILKWMPLTSAYANKSVTVLWGILWGKLFFQEKVTISRIFGAALIITGIFLIAYSENGEEA